MTYALHFFPDNANLPIRMVLEELGLGYDGRLVDRRSQEHRGEAYRRINPCGLIPAMLNRERDSLLFETGAILLYISEAETALGVAADKPRERADFLKWLFLLSNTLHADLRLHYYSEHFVNEPTAAKSVYWQAGLRTQEHLRLLDQAAACWPTASASATSTWLAACAGRCSTPRKERWIAACWRRCPI